MSNVTHPAQSEGMKYDQGKAQLELLSSSWLFGVGNVLTFGAKKYAAHNWRKGIQLSRLLGAALRHTLAFLQGEDTDPETGLSHLYHASCCLMFASELYETNPGMDDRWKAPKQRKKRTKRSTSATTVSASKAQESPQDTASCATPPFYSDVDDR